eukprot:5555035-Prymnesium_polylepis.1
MQSERNRRLRGSRGALTRANPASPSCRAQPAARSTRSHPSGRRRRVASAATCCFGRRWNAEATRRARHGR